VQVHRHAGGVRAVVVVADADHEVAAAAQIDRELALAIAQRDRPSAVAAAAARAVASSGAAIATGVMRRATCGGEPDDQPGGPHAAIVSARGQRQAILVAPRSIILIRVSKLRAFACGHTVVASAWSPYSTSNTAFAAEMNGASLSQSPENWKHCSFSSQSND